MPRVTGPTIRVTDAGWKRGAQSGAVTPARLHWPPREPGKGSPQRPAYKGQLHPPIGGRGTPTSGQGLCEISVGCEARNAYFIPKAREEGDRVEGGYCYFHLKVFNSEIPLGKPRASSPSRRKVGRGVEEPHLWRLHRRAAFTETPPLVGCKPLHVPSHPLPLKQQSGAVP